MVILAAVLALVGLGIWRMMQTDASGRSRTEQWISSQIQAIANQHLNPQLSFDSLDYQFPGTVVLKGVRMIADAVAIFEVDSMTLELTETPRIGKPIQIQHIGLTEPTLRLIGSGPSGARLLGWSDIVKSDAQQVTTSEEPIKLSDVLRIRSIELIDGVIEYDPRLPASDMMRFDGLTMHLNLTDALDGWHAVTLRVDRRPLLEIVASGRLNLDDGLLDLVKLTIAADVSRSTHQYFPPRIQRWMREHEINGNAQLTMSGSIDLNEPLHSMIDLRFVLHDGMLAFGEYRLPVQMLTLQAMRVDDVVDVTELSITTLGGSIDASGSIELTDEPQMDALVRIDKVRLEQAIKPELRTADSPPKLAGRLDGNFRLQGPVADITRNAGGEGHIDLTEGRIVRIPVFSAILETGKSAANGSAKPGDAAVLEWTFDNDKLKFQTINMTTSSMVVRGRGTMDFQTNLDLRLNGGPLEKVQSLLGPAGQLMGKLTDSLMHYQVTGTLADPQVNMRLARVEDANLGNGTTPAAPPMELATPPEPEVIE